MALQYGRLVQKAKPFVKWAGGKRQLIQVLSDNMPEKYGTYYEPFLGGGAFLFHILEQNPFQRCVVSDTNADLILTYVTVRDRPEELIASLKRHAREYERDRRVYYGAIRASTPKSEVAKSSRLIFLNRTCFNGLYRVNKKGKFNVPIGSYMKPNIVNEENIRATSSLLRASRIKIICGDFESIVRDATKGDFAYFDPPYKPVSKTASFTSYSADNFGDSELDRLATLCNSLAKKRCYVMTTNSNVSGITDIFGGSWNVQRIVANRAINSNANKRTGHKELLLKNY
ncbi:MAG: DNA adenine methylase [Cenarchaeum symbiont of Oopsacas minuta]|nr:DNA adenine methylase [Cenarchaeum symbiont of Oopsacas minuta]